MNNTQRNARIGFESELQPMRVAETRSKAAPALAGAAGGDPPRRPSGMGKGEMGHYAPDISPTFKPLPIRLSAPPWRDPPSIPPRKPGPIVILGGDAFDTGGKSPSATPVPSGSPRPTGPILMLGGEALEPPSARTALFVPLPAPPRRPLLILGGEVLDAPPLKRAHTL